MIFLENSGYDLRPLARVAERENRWGRAVEFVSLDCNEIVPDVHYGYSEFKLLHLGLQRSGLIRPTDLVIKATGRYTFPHINRLIARLPRAFEFAADTKEQAWLIPHPQRFIRVGLLLFNVRFYRDQWMTAYQGMRPYTAAEPRKAFIENVLYDRLLPWRGRPGCIFRFPCSCEPMGVGGNGVRYDSPRQRAGAFVRHVGRTFFPDWWV